MLCNVGASSTTAMTRPQSLALRPIMPHLKHVPAKRVDELLVMVGGRGACRGSCDGCWARG
eukprot:275706-Heterocapsa_arctica.AAC.1